VLAVARLVEKKGLRYLIEAAALVPLDRLTIIGDGPLRGELEALVDRLGLSPVVELPGWRDPDEIRAALERANVLAMPCVVAADGDRDTMPVVVKEALAMEVPVVASDEVGLPELVRPGWGRLVPPRDTEGLAVALTELLERTADEQSAMGRAGRAWVLEHCNIRRETEKLVRLIDAASR
jgi:glycosyltransferase involved in cell wall biosynthesis